MLNDLRYEIINPGIRCLCLVSHRRELSRLRSSEFEVAMHSAIRIITGYYKCSSKLKIDRMKLKIQNVKHALLFIGNLVCNNGAIKVSCFLITKNDK